MDRDEAHSEIAYYQRRSAEDEKRHEAELEAAKESSFRAGWESAMNHHSIPSAPGLEEALQQHLES